ncbi:hypothetical protein HF086_000051, partial [Spodoptera exigua]
CAISMNPDAMRSARVVQIILFLTLCLGLQAKVYKRCELTRELLKNNFSRTFLSNWVCLIEQESERNTSAIVVKSSRRKFYGLFQIGSEWCKEGKKGGKCDIACEVSKVLQRSLDFMLFYGRQTNRSEGILWIGCPDWVHPPSRVSPPRDKRTARGKRSIRRFSRRSIFLNQPY